MSESENKAPDNALPPSKGQEGSNVESPASPNRPRRKKSAARRVLTVLGVIFALLVLAIVVIPLVVPAEKWKQLAFEQLEANTGLVGEAESASVSILPLGLKMSGLRIEDPAKVTTLDQFSFALDQVVVRASLGSILRGEPEVQEVRLVRPVVELSLPAPKGDSAEVNGEGDTSSGQDATAQPEIVAALGLLSIEDGRITIHDGAGTTISLTGLDNGASLRAAGGEASGDIEGSLARVTVTGDSLPAPIEVAKLSWKLGLRARMDGTRGTIDVHSFDVLGIRAKGTVGFTEATSPAPVLDVALDLEGSVEKFWADFARAQVAAGELPPPMTIDDIALAGGTLVAKATYRGAIPKADPSDPLVALRPLVLEGTVSGLRLDLLGEKRFTTASAGIRLADNALSLRDVVLEGDFGRATGKFDVGVDLVEPLTGELRANVDLAGSRDLAERMWPRLLPFVQVEGEPEVVGPDEWPGVTGSVQVLAQLRIAADGSFDPLTADPSSIQWQAVAKRVAALTPALTDSVWARDVEVRGDLKNAIVEKSTLEGPGLLGDAIVRVGGWPEKTEVRGQIRAVRLDLDVLQAAVVAPTEEASIDLLRTRSVLDRLLGVEVARAQGAKSKKGELPPPPPANLDVDVQLVANEVMSGGYTLRDISANPVLVNQKLDLRNVQGKLGTGTVSGVARVDWTANPPAFDTDMKAADVPASTLLEPVAGPLAQTLQTNFSGELKLDGALALEPEQIIQALSGVVDFSSSNGVLAAEELLGPSVSRFLGNAADKWRQLDFSSLTANLKVESGRVFFNKLLVRGSTELNATGSVGLDGSNDYRLDIRLPRGVVPDLGSLQPVADLLKDGDGRFMFGVNVKGQGSKPKVEIDFADLQSRATDAGKDRLRDEAKDRVGGSIGDKLDDVLDRNGLGGDGNLGGKLNDLLGGRKSGAAAPDSTASAASESTVVDPKQGLEDKAKEAAGGLLDRLKRKKGGGGD